MFDGNKITHTPKRVCVILHLKNDNGGSDMKSVCLINGGMDADAFGILSGTCEKELARRGVKTDARDGYGIRVAVDPSLANDTFRLLPGSDGAAVSGATLSAVFHGVGVLLRRLKPDGRGGFTPLAEAVTFTPVKPLRGMYFATHFGNFYHAAPIEEVLERVVLSAMRGYNELLVWFDMHHFASMEDPEAVALTERLHTVLQYANRVGMGASILMLANEGFSSSPVSLRARFEVENGYQKVPLGHFGCEICPSVPGGVEEILRERREMLAKFADLRMDYVILWPYDQGGCTCHACAPWGGNGYLRLLPHCRALLNELMPNAKIIVSTWLFDSFTDGEWDAFAKAAQGDTDAFAGVDCFMASAVPEKVAQSTSLRWISFPEISMAKCAPWGGFGASVLTERLQERLVPELAHMEGGFPYSEGIFEDANEFIVAGLYTGEFADAQSALRAYVEWEFCCADEALYKAVLDTEVGLKRESHGNRAPFRILNPEKVTEVAQVLERYRKTLPEPIATGRTFRLLYLRSVADEELIAHDGDPLASGRSVAALEEIDRIYHVTDTTSVWVRTPVWRLHPEANPEHCAV